MKKFWNWIKNDAGERILRLEGPIDEDNFWGDSVTPDTFREELESEEGDVTVWINSPGGSVFAAASIYTMLCDHKGKVTVKIDAIAASAASVVAMAGDRVLISPVGMLMIHDPMTIAMGSAKDMEKVISTLNEVKESIINAYAKKTRMSRNKISKLMENETWLNAKKAVELGFADEVLFAEGEENEGEESDDKEVKAAWQPYSMRAMGQAILNRIVPAAGNVSSEPEENSDKGGDAEPDVEPAPAGVGTEAATPTLAAEEPEAAAPAGEDQQMPACKPLADKTQSADTAAKESETQPVIGMDGKTKDGAMPYELLKKQLDLLK